MMERGQYTLNEILSQPVAWAQALEMIGSLKTEINQLWNDHPKIRVVFAGCGSTYYLSLAAAALFQELTGREARAVPAGELILYPKIHYEADKPTLLVAISRSGTTTETIVAAQQFMDANRGPLIVITNYEDTPLTELSDLSIVIPAGQEKSVAQTRSFASMYLAATSFAVLSAGRLDLLEQMSALPAIGEQLIRKYKNLARMVGENLAIDRFYFLGSGPRPAQPVLRGERGHRAPA